MRRGRLARLTGLVVVSIAALGVLGSIAFFTLPRLMGWHGVVVLTGSMEPALKVGSLAFIDEGVGASEIRAGDIITFRDPSADRQLTHRVVEVVGSGSGIAFRTRGDANDTADQTPVPASSLVGREVFAVSEIGNWSNWIREKNHLVLILWLPAALVIAGEVSNIIGDLRRKGPSEKDPPARGETVVESH